MDFEMQRQEKFNELWSAYGEAMSNVIPAGISGARPSEVQLPNRDNRRGL